MGLSVKLRDVMQEGPEVQLKVGPDGIDLLAEGFGTLTMQPGYGGIAYLEYAEGRLRLLVWADINQEDPTHIIDLEGARESARKPEKGEQANGIRYFRNADASARSGL